MGAVIKLIVIGSLILGVIIFIPPLFGNISPLVTGAFTSEIGVMVSSIFNIIPEPLISLFLGLISALVIAIIIRFTINEK